MQTRQVIRLIHDATGREVPVEVPTVFGRQPTFYRYHGDDANADRLDEAAVARLQAINYVQIEADTKVSRTHGLLDPYVPGLSDLNSTNGTHLNGGRLPTDYGRVPPMLQVSDGDRIRVGLQQFRLAVRADTWAGVCQRAAQDRVALVGCGPLERERGVGLATFLRDRKSFRTHLATDLRSLASVSLGLPRQEAASGLFVVALRCAVDGLELRLGGEVLPFEGFLRYFAGVRGRKVLALEVDGDPTACEALFADRAGEDAMLLTGPPPAALTDSLHNTVIGTHGLKGIRDSVCGGGRPGAYDDVIDGLDALVAPDTNRLTTDWVQGYTGRLQVTFGTRVDSGSAVSHSLRLGTATHRFGGRFS